MNTAVKSACVVLLGLAVTAIVTAWTVHREEQHTRSEFENYARDVSEAVRHQIALDVDALDSLSAFFRSSEEVTREEFRDFTQSILKRHPEIQALQWVPRISGEQRALYEAQGLQFTELDAAHNLVPAAQRAEYYPALFVEPEDANRPVIGFDLGSRESRLAPILKAAGSGQMVATGMVTLVQTMTSGFLLMEPLYQGGDAPSAEHLRGLTVVVFDIDKLIHKTLDQFSNRWFEILVADQNATPGRERLYPRDAVVVERLREKGGAFAFHQEAAVADHVWRIECVANEAFYAQFSSTAPWRVGAAGAAFSALLGLLFHMALARTAAVERQVALRTRELNEQKQLSQSMLQCIGEGVAVCDLRGNFTLFNPAAQRILGMGASGGGPEKWQRAYGLFLPDRSTPYPVEQLPLTRALQGLDTDGAEIFVRNDALSEGKFISVTGRPLYDEARRITGGVAVFNDITDRKLREEELSYRATHDTLTPLRNRRYFMEQLELQAAAARRHGFALALCVCDLDHFKQVNDQYGHDKGDEAIRRFAAIIEDNVREEDLACRLGGDEFCLLFSHCDTSGARVVLERIRAQLERARFEADGRAFSLTTSMGLAQFQPERMSDAEAFFKAGDEALYRAKQQGRNRLVAVA